MTPLFFRACVLISEKIISYEEFMNMKYFDFRRLEAFVMFKNERIANRHKAKSTQQTKAKLHNLPAKDISELGFSDEQIQGLMNGNN